MGDTETEALITETHQHVEPKTKPFTCTIDIPMPDKTNTEQLIKYYGDKLGNIYNNNNNVLEFSIKIPANMENTDMLKTYKEYYEDTVLSDVFEKINNSYDEYMNTKTNRDKNTKRRGATKRTVMRALKKTKRALTYLTRIGRKQDSANTTLSKNNAYDKQKLEVDKHFKLLKTELRHLKVILKDLVNYVSNPTVSEAFNNHNRTDFNLSIITYSLYKYIRNYHNKNQNLITNLTMYNYSDLEYAKYKSMYSNTLLKSLPMSQLSQLPNTQVFIGTFNSNILVKYKSLSKQLNSLLDVQAKPITKFKYIIQLSLKDHETRSVLEAMIFKSTTSQAGGGNKAKALNNFKRKVVDEVQKDDTLMELIVQYDISKNNNEKTGYLENLKTMIDNIMRTTNETNYNILKKDKQIKTYNQFIGDVLEDLRKTDTYTFFSNDNNNDLDFSSNTVETIPEQQEPQELAPEEELEQEPRQYKNVSNIAKAMRIKFANANLKPLFTVKNTIIFINVKLQTYTHENKINNWIHTIFDKSSSYKNIKIKLKYVVDTKLLINIVIAYCNLYYDKKIQEIIKELNKISNDNDNTVIPIEGQMQRNIKQKAKAFLKTQHEELEKIIQQNKDYEDFKNAYKTQLRLLKRELVSLKRIINDLLKYVTNNKKVIDIITTFTRDNIKIIPVSHTLIDSLSLGNTFTPYNNTNLLMDNIGTIHKLLYENKKHIAETHKPIIFINNDKNNDNNLLIFDKNSKQQDTFITFDENYKYKYALQIVIGNSDILTDLHVMFTARSEPNVSANNATVAAVPPPQFISQRSLSKSKTSKKNAPPVLHTAEGKSKTSRSKRRSSGPNGSSLNGNTNNRSLLANEQLAELKNLQHETGTDGNASPQSPAPQPQAEEGAQPPPPPPPPAGAPVGAPPPPPPPPAAAGRGFLNAIEAGTKLKPVPETERKRYSTSMERVLANRFKATHGESEKNNGNAQTTTPNNEWNEPELYTSNGGSRKHNSRSTQRIATKKRKMY
jgi:hypothetical protein